MAMEIKEHFSQGQSVFKATGETWPQVLYILHLCNVCLGSYFSYIKGLGDCVFKILQAHIKYMDTYSHVNFKGDQPQLHLHLTTRSNSK